MKKLIISLVSTAAICASLAFLALWRMGYAGNSHSVTATAPAIGRSAVASPLEAYNGFYEALAAGDQERALSYLAPEARAAFAADIMRDPDVLRRQIDHKAGLHLISEQACGPHEPGCRRSAVYGYRYEVTEAYSEQIDGVTVQVEPQAFSLEMTFIQLPDGSWQISEL